MPTDAHRLHTLGRLDDRHRRHLFSASLPLACRQVAALLTNTLANYSEPTRQPSLSPRRRASRFHHPHPPQTPASA